MVLYHELRSTLARYKLQSSHRLSDTQHRQYSNILFTSFLNQTLTLLLFYSEVTDIYTLLSQFIPSTKSSSKQQCVSVLLVATDSLED